jgi:hypothetical protein
MDEWEMMEDMFEQRADEFWLPEITAVSTGCANGRCSEHALGVQALGTCMAGKAG